MKPSLKVRILKNKSQRFVRMNEKHVLAKFQSSTVNGCAQICTARMSVIDHKHDCHMCDATRRSAQISFSRELAHK